MSTDFHTPYQDGVTQYKSAHMNAPLAELDEAIGNLIDAGVGIGFEETAKPVADGVYSLILPYNMTIAADCSGSSFYNKTNPSAEVQVSIKQNGTEFATLTVSSGGSPTWSASETELASGDRISFVFPSSQNSTWAGVVITLRGART